MAEEAKAGGHAMSPASSHGKAASTGESSDKIEMTLQRSLIDEAMGDINGLMKQARIRPHFTEGKADGLLVYGVKQRSIFKEMGIRNGDILMGIDGNKIQSVEDAISLYDKLKNASEAKIEVKRRGKTKEFLYHVE
jgi:general secretion pathway protein C